MGQDWWNWLGIDCNTGRICEQMSRGGESYTCWALSPDERRRGYVRPLRYTYTHISCGRDTAMSQGSAELWARAPFRHQTTLCVHCDREYPVGNRGQFVWLGSSERVGT